MILAIDVKYYDDHYKTCGVLFENFNSKEPTKILSLKVNKRPNDYIPGEFYKRERPCIVEFMKYYNLNPEYIIVDGFVNLYDNEDKHHYGLGSWVYSQLTNLGWETIKLIGVAKSNFCKTNEHAENVYRGKSKNPLYVQWTGWSTGKDEVHNYIKNMYGSYRIPEMLKIMDFYTKHDGESEICNEITNV